MSHLLYSGVVGVHGLGAVWSLIAVGLFTKQGVYKRALQINDNHIGLFYVSFFSSSTGLNTCRMKKKYICQMNFSSCLCFNILKGAHTESQGPLECIVTL